MAKVVDGVLVVRSSVTVSMGRDDAFRFFTERMGEWWPLESHSVYDDPNGTIEVEPRVGGRIVERASDGRECPWGVVSEWEPGRRMAMSWYPGMAPSLATQVDVRFHDAPGGGTRVDLMHIGWEALGDEAAERAAGYQTGWGVVLGHFVEAAQG